MKRILILDDLKKFWQAFYQWRFNRLNNPLPKITTGQSLEELSAEIKCRKEWTYRTPFTWKSFWLKLRHWWTHRNFIFEPNRRMTADVRLLSQRHVILPDSYVPHWGNQFKDMKNVDYRLDATTGLDDAKELIFKERNQ